LQEEIVLLNILEYCLGCKAVKIMQYEPNQPHLRYVLDGPPVDKKNYWQQ
jgi:hypothetical protein